MQVRTLVDQTEIGELSIGQAAQVTVDAFPERRFTGMITRWYSSPAPMARRRAR